MDNINIPYNVDEIIIKTYNKCTMKKDECLLKVKLTIEEIINKEYNEPK